MKQGTGVKITIFEDGKRKRAHKYNKNNENNKSSRKITSQQARETIITNV